MAERYFWPNPNSESQVPAAQIAELSGDEARHLIRVMRQKSGDVVTLFDGHGCEYRAEITNTRKDRVELRIFETRRVDTESQRQVTIAVSLPKGDRQKWLVEKLTELGCRCLIPLWTERGVVQPTVQVIERLRRQVIEATKQCNRSELMQISPVQTVVECVSGYVSGVANDGKMVGWIAHPHSDGEFGQHDLASVMQTALPKNVLVLIGPEGGFTHQEVEQAVTLGLQPLDLGPRILRVETAAMVLTAILSARV